MDIRFVSKGGFSGSSVREIQPNNRAGLIIAKVSEVHRVVRNFNEPLRSGEIRPGEEVVVVNDVDHTGSSLEKLINIVRRFNGRVSKVLVFATWDYEDFQKRMSSLEVTGFALIEFRAEHWTKDVCPVCSRGNDDLMPASDWS